MSGAGGTGGRGSVAGVTTEPLREYRESIDNIDAALIFLLAERFKITKKVGAFKASTGLPPSDPDRERNQIARLRRLADTAHLDPEFSEKFLRFIVDEVIRHHQRQAEEQRPLSEPSQPTESEEIAMTRYEGTIRVQVLGTTERVMLDDVTIEDMNVEDWQTSVGRDSLPLESSDEPAEVIVELMDGDRAGWTSRANATADGGSVQLRGTEAFMVG